MVLRWLTVGWLIFITISGYAQSQGEVCKWVDTINTPYQLDSLSIVPGSIRFASGPKLEIIQDISKGTVTFKTNHRVDSVHVCYRVFPVSLHKNYYNRSRAIYDSSAIFKDPVKKESIALKRNELFTTEGLNKSGSLSRGISFGNNQDVFVNSTLNLNLDGKLTDDLNIRAAITDQNVPYQPEGNTQQLQDFDNVYIQIYNDKFSLTGGDVVLQSSPSYFLKYYKNVQGGLAELKYNLGDSGRAESSFGISVAKGRFASVQIPPLEGVSGPYRIPGPNNERFIIILANSERVFVDGQQLKRGFNNDYIIDYNSGELTFTNQILITQFSRIRVDYEFSDQNYSRTITAASHYQQTGRLKLFANAYSEKDNRSRPILADLSREDQILLSNIGDNLDQAIASGADSVDFSNEQVLYEKLDTLDQDGVVQTIFRFSTDPVNARFRVTFSEVASGNYVQKQSTSNGRVFEWISPINGQPQGQFEPVITLPAPNKKQLTNVGLEYAVSKHEQIYGEVAFSSQDLNLFSDIDADDDNGVAFKVGLKSNERPIGFLPKFKLSSYVDFELDDKNFNPIDRFRYIEFDRDWSFNPNMEASRSDDRIINVGILLRDETTNEFSYSLTNRKRGNAIDGYQHRAFINQTIGKVNIKSSFFNLNNDQQTSRSDWTRYSLDLSFKGGKFIPGYIYNLDHNSVAFAENDSIISSALYFDEHIGYLKSTTKSGVEFDLRHSYREDKRPSNGEIADFTFSNTSSLRLNKTFKKNKVALLFLYRDLQNIDAEQDEETISGRLDWRGNWFDKHVTSELTYSIANSRELRREFIYIRVPPGQGTHTWRDLNDDGVQDLTEFFEAVNPDERNYAKIFTPTNNFITAFQNIFIYRVNFITPRSWRTKTGLRKFLSRFSNNTSWSADTKTTDDDLGSRLFAFAKDLDEESLVTERNLLRSTLFYNRTSSKYGLEGTYTNQGQKQFLSAGFESRDLEEFSSSARLNLSRRFVIRLRTGRAEREVSSDFLDNRNYRIKTYRLNPEVSWQPKNNLRLTLQYNYQNKNNELNTESSESAVFNEFIGELKINKAIKSSFNARIRLVDIEFEGEENTPLGYELLEALRPGRNVTWSVNWLQKITSGLQLNLIYDGRKSEGNRVVHVGRVQVSALF